MDSLSTYLLIFRNTGPENYQPLSPDERDALVRDWNRWYTELLEDGTALEGQPLEDATRVVSGVGGKQITDGPFSEAKEAIGGYVKVRVSGLEAATAIAQRHPALPYGLIIEVRELTSGCHLGVDAHQQKPASMRQV